jgi:hypothetical protein
LPVNTRARDAHDIARVPGFALRRPFWQRALAGALAVWSAATPVLNPPPTTPGRERMTAAAMSDHGDHRCVHTQHHRSGSHESGGPPTRHQPCDCCHCSCCLTEGLNLTIGWPATLPVSPTIEFAATPSFPGDWPSDAAAQIALPPPLGPPAQRL